MQKTAHSKILILTGSIGSGHLSVARAISEAIYRLHPKNVNVETVDFISAQANLASTATKKIYLGSLKLSPKIYELIFSSSNMWDWPIKLLNTLSAPFMQEKFLSLMRRQRPDVLVSTFPLWDILIKKSWQRYLKEEKKRASFVSVLTDSMNVHSFWTTGEPDFFIAPDEDTRISLRNLGVTNKRIKVFGYPVSERFSHHTSREEFQSKWNLSPRRRTLLLILSTGMQWAKIKRLTAVLQRSTIKNAQLMIITGTNDDWRKKLSNISWPFGTRITGWTKEMHTFIHASDIVLMKAGGATVMECVNSKKPMVIIDAIPGQEIGNAMLVQKYNLGVVLDADARNLDAAINYIFDNEALIKKNLASIQKPHAAEKVARFLMQLSRAG